MKQSGLKQNMFWISESAARFGVHVTRRELPGWPERRDQGKMLISGFEIMCLAPKCKFRESKYVPGTEILISRVESRFLASIC